MATRRLLEEQLVVVAILGSGKKSDAMGHVPQVIWNDVDRATLKLEVMRRHLDLTYIFMCN